MPVPADDTMAVLSPGCPQVPQRGRACAHRAGSHVVPRPVFTALTLTLTLALLPAEGRTQFRANGPDVPAAPEPPPFMKLLPNSCSLL